MNKIIGSLGAVALLLGFVACGLGAPDDGTADAGRVGDSGNGYSDASTAQDAGSGRTDASQGGPDASVAHDAGSSADASRADASTPGKDAGGSPAGHDLILGGVAHKSGNTDPLKNCVSCHGAALKGGTGRSCYDCHDSNDHTVKRGSAMHRSGSRSTCNPCHGPNNTGGLGPACSKCH